MVEAAASLVEVAIGVVAGLLQLALVILIASVRPWRYALSPGYRATVAAELQGRHTLYRAMFFLWGSFALVASIATVVGLWWLFASLPAAQPQAPSKLGEKVHHLQEKASELKGRLGR